MTTTMQSLTAQQLMRRRGSTFAWAGMLLPAEQQRDIARLYGFCRTVDDWADEGGDPAAAGFRLEALRRALRRGDDGHPEGAVLLALAERYGFGVEPAIALLDGMLEDLGSVRVRTRGELVRYAYRVAGTVGEMMCPILGCRNARAVPFAIDLGIAMQLTNIARDVLEDAERGRIYLPLPPGVEAGDLLAGRPAAREAAYEQVLAALALADQHYRSADRGVALLPARSRPAVLVASRVYEAIGNEIRLGGRRAYWRRRARVGKGRRLWHSARALAALPRLPAGGRHEACLHAPLARLSGGLP
ncbi:MAG: phytoene/squalene synthase family protein [Acidobacteriota bacterium]